MTKRLEEFYHLFAGRFLVPSPIDADAFKNSASALTKAMKYHERLEEIQLAFKRIAELIEKHKNDLKTADRDKFDDNELDCNSTTWWKIW